MTSFYHNTPDKAITCTTARDMTEQKTRTIKRAGLQQAADHVNCAKTIPVDHRSPGRRDGKSLKQFSFCDSPPPPLELI